MCPAPSSSGLVISSASTIQAYFVLRFPILRWVSPLLFICILQGIAAGIGTSNFLRAAFIVSLNSSSFGSMKNIPLNCLALRLGMFICPASKRTNLIRVCGRYQTDRPSKFSWKTLIWENQHHFLTMYIWVALKKRVSNQKGYCRKLQKYVRIQDFCWSKENLPTRASGKLDAETISSWSHDMESHAKKCVEGYCEVANKTTKLRHHVWMIINLKKKNWISWRINCPQFANKLFWNVCIWLVLVHLILCGLWTNLRVLSQNGQNLVTNAWRVWSRTFITHWQSCYGGNTAQQCRLGLFQESDFAGDLEDPKSTSGGVLCIFGSHTFVPISWMCKKQTSVSHSSAESDIISLMFTHVDGILVPNAIQSERLQLNLWDLTIEVFHSVPNRTYGPKREPRRNPSAVVKPNMHNPIPIQHTNVIPTNTDHIPPKTTHSGSSATLYVFEDNEAVIKMIIKGRSPSNETCFQNPQSCSGLVVWQE